MRPCPQSCHCVLPVPQPGDQSQWYNNELQFDVNLECNLISLLEDEDNDRCGANYMDTCVVGGFCIL